jgi:hypothetical protein
MIRIARPVVRLGIFACCVALAGAGRVLAADAPAAPAAAGPLAGVKPPRIFITGHSFHVFIYGPLLEAARNAGIADQEIVGVSRIGGSRVIQHWNVADDKNEAKTALKAGKVDVLTLAPIWLPDEGIANFARLAVENNPKIRILVQEYWLPNDTYEPKYPLDTKKKVDHNATDVAELAKSNAAYERDIEAHLEKINQELKTDALVVVPVGEASVRLREKIVAGTAPGLKTQWDLFRDTWGHAKGPLMMLSTYCHFAVIYGRSPVGLPMPAMLQNDATISDADKPALNRLLQEIAWDTVRRHKMTGVMEK